MTNTLNDTTKTRGSRTVATEHDDLTVWSTVSTVLRTASTTLRIASTVWRGLDVVSALVALARSIDGSDGLVRLRPGRRRGPLEAVTIFGAGLAVGAGIGVMLAPRSGADLRRAILGRSAT
jgi:hypothetical protein